MSVQIIGQEVGPRLSWAGLTAALEAGHLRPRAEIRDMVLYRGGDTLLNRAAWIDGLGQLVKVATVFPGNGAQGLPSVNGAVTLYDDKTGVLTALVDFHLVTKWKTAGDSLLSARRLARKDSRRILLVGAGAVARSMVSAYSSAFPQAAFKVWSRSRASAEAMGLPVAEDLEQAVKAADIICTCTMSREPLVQGAWLQPGQHLDLIGAYTAAMREVDDAAMARARVFVDSRATTIGHIGELIEPMKSGAISEADVIADFYDDPAGFVRRSEDEITIAKNGGGAHLDLMTADYIARMAGERPL
ncbi:ornithine cyclodeaminase [Pseudotabrizicola sp. 4114]|uniref:ornithine cyclodeaminase family protein n=1 Tax=Pseudotabrizicola sp. 4114 TaxID=2817731 RepID=UPI002857C481|nr:ornithine cyclodeaminase [Pseudorhodobacter sp. 4114]